MKIKTKIFKLGLIQQDILENDQLNLDIEEIRDGNCRKVLSGYCIPSMRSVYLCYSLLHTNDFDEDNDSGLEVEEIVMKNLIHEILHVVIENFININTSCLDNICFERKFVGKLFSQKHRLGPTLENWT